MVQVFDHSFYTAYSPCKKVKIVLYFCPNQEYAEALISAVPNGNGQKCGDGGSLFLMPVLTIDIYTVVLIISDCNAVSNLVAKFGGRETISE